VETIERQLIAHGVPYFLQTHEAVFASPGIAEATEEYFRRSRAERAAHLAALGARPTATPTLNRHRPLDEVDRDRVAKAVFISSDPGALPRVTALLQDGFDVLPGSIPLPAGSNGEIGLLGVSKGSAILEVLALLDLDPADSIGIGDSWNDVAMFEVVGTPIAMGNAAPELQELAGQVTTAVLDDGIHNAFRRLGLI
jgi:hydroxymethylpyrimidine pyrophosphatase-like HAD family hydrolase